MDTLKPLVRHDGLQIGTLGSTPCFVHKDHRWLLPIICAAQEAGHIPRPVTVVMFDYHPDIWTRTAWSRFGSCGRRVPPSRG